MLNHNELFLFQEKYSELTETERNEISTIINKLLNKTFLIRELKNDHAHFYKCIEHSELISLFFQIIDYSLVINDSNEVIYIKTNVDRNRVSLLKLDSIIILILRLAYYKKRKELSLSQEVFITFEELENEVNKTKIYNNFKKENEYRESLKKLRNLKIIDFEGSAIYADLRIRILPSIQVIIDLNSEENLLTRIQSYQKDEGENKNEEINEDQID